MDRVLAWQLAAMWFFVAAFALAGVVAVVAAVVQRRRAERRHREREEDPLTTLQLQLRLGQIAREIRALAGDDTRFAGAHHSRAAQAAYDELLREACRRAGIGDDKPIVTESDRLLLELELSSRGWSW